MIDRTGQQLDHYRLIRTLGRGSFGEVYLAEDTHRKTQVAVKILQSSLDEQNIADFLMEARTFRLEHPHILRIRDFGVEEGFPFIVMDYISRGNLRQRHPRGTRIPLDVVISYAEQIAGALQSIHDEGLVHRDVKPENMLVGSNDTILLSDFGIATTSFTIDLGHLQLPRGTPSYIPRDAQRDESRQAVKKRMQTKKEKSL